MDTDIPLDIQLPSYEIDVSEHSPTYSERPGITEIRLHPEPFAPQTSSSTQHWVCETKHMKIDLGPHIWGLNAPSYGLNGVVEGTILFLNKRPNVEQVSVTFEGRLTTSRPAYHAASGDNSSTLISRTISLYSSCAGSTFDWETEHKFSIPIPAEINADEGQTPSPPSYNCYYYGSSMEVAYYIKVDMIHRVTGIRMHETKLIPIYYLPKSHPSEAPLSAIPRPSRLRDDSDLYLSWLNRVHTVPMTPQWPNSKCKLELSSFEKSVFLSIPNPPKFCSGDSIPFGVSLIYPNDPAFAKILTRCIRVILLKRIVFGTKRRILAVKSEETENPHHEWPLDSGTLKSQNEFAEGIRLLRGSIKAGVGGKEASWTVDGTGVQYILQASIIPPRSMAGHIPNFQSELVVDITTDHWDPLPHIDHCVIRGIPTPAIGLASDPQANWIGNSSYSAMV